MSKLSHFDPAGQPRMVDVSEKGATRRTARAHAFVRMSRQVLDALPDNPKGDPLAVARVAGVMAAKRTAELIPLCHPLGLDHVEVKFRVGRAAIEIICTAETSAQTGVEMEALTGVSVAALALYDMCKAVDKTMRIEGIRVVKKVKE